MKLSRIIAFLAASSLLVSGVFVSASHSWGTYHWARTSNPFNLNLGDNVSSAWDSYLGVASTDWSASSVLDTQITAGRTNPKNCRPASGRVEICNSRYGNNGWLGIASIWVSGSHITQAAMKLNDTYFNTATYNTPSWRQFVMCQEIGHTLGLDHQDEDFGNPNLGSCMDYTSDPAANQHPNQHDYDQLEAIYEHLDSATTISSGSLSSGKGHEVSDDQATWGKVVKRSADGKSSLHEKDLGRGQKVFTFVIWAR